MPILVIIHIGYIACVCFPLAQAFFLGVTMSKAECVNWKCELRKTCALFRYPKESENNLSYDRCGVICSRFIKKKTKIENLKIKGLENGNKRIN